MELGHLLTGRIALEYPVDYGWQEDFFSFLEDVGFDSHGYIQKDELKEYKKEEAAIYLTYHESSVSAEEIKKLGTFLRHTEPVLWREDDGAEYRTSLYQLNGKLYELEPNLESKYHEMLDVYEDTLWTWEETLSEEQWHEYLNGELMIPYEIQHIKPNPKDYKKVFKVWEAEERVDTHYYFDNGTFILRPYYWGSSDELLNKPNFEYKDIKIQWYKYFGRDTYSNKKLTKKEFDDILNECRKSI